MAEFISLYSGSSGNSSVVRCGASISSSIWARACAPPELRSNRWGWPSATVRHPCHPRAQRPRQGAFHLPEKEPAPVYGARIRWIFWTPTAYRPANCELQHAGRPGRGHWCVWRDSFPTSHDVPCVGYRIHTPDGKTMTLATDLGVLTPPVHEALSGCDLVALESNYDLHMLRSGPYPYYLRARIESVPGDTFPTTSAPQSCWSSFRRAAKSLPCAISRRRTTRPSLPCRPCSHLGCSRCRTGKRLHCAGTAPQRNKPCWNFDLWNRKTPAKADSKVFHLLWRMVLL